ncbi:MAG: DUF2141 domain-containing protein [Bacteroidota bacterium]
MKNVIALIATLVFPWVGFSCTSFKYVDAEQVWAAKNFDWHNGMGYVIKNNRNQAKCSYLNYDGLNTCWTSKYGSITFNQNGKEFPYGGINEKGLVVEMLWLKETIYQEDGAEATKLSELEWIQYQLDNYGTVDEVLAHIDRLIIDPITSTIHYFVVDQSGKSAVIEFIDREVAITVSTAPTQSITNSSHAVSDAFFGKSESKLGDYYVPKNMDSRLRYCSVRNNLEKFPTDQSFGEEAVFEILGNVAEDRGAYKTYWTILYDLTNLQVAFKTFDNQTARSLSLSDFDFNANTTYYDLSSDSEQRAIGDLMEAYTAAVNFSLVEECIKPNLSFDYEQVNAHQMNPHQSNTDQMFADNHRDITITIVTKEATGAVRYFLADSEENYRRQGPYGGFVEINSEKTEHILYSVPTNKQYAFGAMHDVNGNGYLDRNFMKIPKEPFAFSGKKRFFFLPPKFEKATFDLSDEVTIEF